MTYEEAVTVIIELNSENDQIPRDLGDFILAAISQTIGRSILVVKPTIEKQVDLNGREVTVYGAYMEYLFKGDKTRSSPNIVGINYFAPATPKEIVRLTSAASMASTHLNDAMRQVQGILDAIPPSDARSHLSKSLMHMGASKKYLEGAKLTTRAAMSTDLPVAVPLPQSESSAVTKASRKRSAPPVIIPEKCKKESEAEFTKRMAEMKASALLKLSCDTKCPANMCICGKDFDNKDEVDAHMANTHTDPKTWKCSYCGKIMNSKGHCWCHVHKHQGRYSHYCHIKTDHPTEVDENTGKPKVVICPTASDEVLFIHYHWETVHKKGRTTCRCSHSDKLQMSIRRKKDHELVCKLNKEMMGDLTHLCKIAGCDYNCRGKDTLCMHMKRDHPESVGLTAPKHWTCKKCQREYKSPGGLRTHTCPKDKPPKDKPAKANKGMDNLCKTNMDNNYILFRLNIIINIST